VVYYYTNGNTVVPRYDESLVMSVAEEEVDHVRKPGTKQRASSAGGTDVEYPDRR
jgi:hypothetical protein